MLLVQKFGGTSVADPERIRAVADHVARTRRAGDDVVVVVSAMGKSTDDLLRLAFDVAEHPDGRELDMLLTAGERISMALVSMAVEDLGVPAMSFTGSQAGIVTDTAHNRAKIIEVKGDRIREALDAGKVAIVAGFQGVSTEREITTLGRGASDLTAVALGRRARRRGVRDLHRRGGRVLRRPAHRAQGAQAGARSRSTRCSRWRPPAGECSRCGRSSSRATTT